MSIKRRANWKRNGNRIAQKRESKKIIWKHNGNRNAKKQDREIAANNGSTTETGIRRKMK